MNKRDDFGEKGKHKKRKGDENIMIKYIALPSDRSVPKTILSHNPSEEYKYATSSLYSKTSEYESVYTPSSK